MKKKKLKQRIKRLEKAVLAINDKVNDMYNPAPVKQIGFNSLNNLTNEANQTNEEEEID